MGQGSVIRRLAAIVIADVVAYTRHMQRDDAGTLVRLQQIRSQLVDPNVAAHGGDIFNATGDAILIEFGSADAALRCAIEIQRAMAVRNSSAAPDTKLELRIGINLGDIIVNGDGIVGDTVNIASRLETMSEPGAICVSGPVRDQVHGDIGVDFVDIGEQQIRNARPIRVYRVGFRDVTRSLSQGQSPSTPSPVRSVVKDDVQATALARSLFQEGDDGPITLIPLVRTGDQLLVFMLGWALHPKRALSSEIDAAITKPTQPLQEALEEARSYHWIIRNQDDTYSLTRSGFITAYKMAKVHAEN